ncbi:MAG: ABC transporter permease, partial [Burkholderiales bacterium]
MTSLLPMMPVVLWTDGLVFLLVAVILVFAWHVRRHEHLLAPWRKVVHSRSGMVAAVVLAAFVAVGLLDSLHFRPRLADGAGGGTASYSVEMLSLFDVVVAHLRARPEKTYSAP